MLRVISEVKPRFVVAENVRGLLSIESGQVFAEIITSLESEGYEVITFCIPASAVEAPHRRDRLWIVGSLTADPRRIETGDAGERLGSERVNSQTPGQRTVSRNRSTNGDFNASHPQSQRPRETRELRRDEQAERITGGDQTNPNSDCEGLPIGGYEPGQQTISAIIGAKYDDNDDSNSAGKRLQRFIQTNSGEGAGPNFKQLLGRHREQPGWEQNWIEVAARLCTLDDGLSRGLVRPVGWRTNALKGAGNSICPLLAFEIFQAIQAAEGAISKI